MSNDSKPFPFPTAENHGERPSEGPKPVEIAPTEDALDRGVEESFPASDPVSVTVTKVRLPSVDDDAGTDTGTAGKR